MRRFLGDVRILDAIPYAVVATDVEGTVLFWSRGAERLFGFSADEMAGRSVGELYGELYERERAALLARDLRTGESRSGDFPVRRSDGSTLLARITDAPIHADGQLVGFVTVAEDVTEVRTLEQQVAASHAEQQAAVRRAGILLRVTSALAEAVTVAQVAETVRDHVRTAFGAVTCSVLLATQGGRELVTVASFGYPPGVEPEPSRSVDADLPTAACFRERRPVVLRRDEVDERFPGLLRQLDAVGSTLAACLPLVTGDQALGVLTLGFSGEESLTDPDRVLLDTIASQCAIALDRARVIARTAEISAQLQAALAPVPLPEVAGVDVAAHYQPGGDDLEQIGGDWYDAVEVDGGRLCLVLGDVMGRGVRAATTMIQVRSAIRGYTAVDPAPEVVFAKTDRLLARDAPEQFVTAVCLLLDPATGVVEVCSAGHLPLLRVAPDGTASYLDLAYDPPLGLAHVRACGRYVLAPGETLLAVTDGVVERPGEDIEVGLARLASAAAQAAAQPLDELVRAVTAVVDEQGPLDDVTLLAVRLRCPEP